MATNIPPHNLGEVIDATIELIQKPEATVPQLMRKVPGPDFPTAGFIHGAKGIRDAYSTGRGIIQMRARAIVEKQARGEKEAIVITEIPYQVNKAKLIERIAELVNEKKLEGIADLRDESDRDGMRIVVDLKRGENSQVILNKLFAQTAMQSTFGIIFLGIVDGGPRVCNLKELLQHFIDHRKTVVVRRTKFDLRKAQERAHMMKAGARARHPTSSSIISGSADPKEAKARLVAEVSMVRSGLEKFIGQKLDDEKGKPSDVIHLDDIQAQAILDMRLHRLTGLEREKIVAEYKEVLALIGRLKEILASESLVRDHRDRAEGHQEGFGNPRRTEIVADVTEIDVEDLIVEEEMVITVSRGGYIKRSPLSPLRPAARRQGVGATGQGEDVVEHLFVASIAASSSRSRRRRTPDRRTTAAAGPARARRSSISPALRPTRSLSRWPRRRTSGGPPSSSRDEGRPHQEDAAAVGNVRSGEPRDQPRG
jgi:DNA gyrase subunit A